MKMLLISEDELLKLLAESHELQALKRGKVDNWEWADYTYMDYLEGAGKESFEEIAKDDLEAYEVVE